MDGTPSAHERHFIADFTDISDITPALSHSCPTRLTTPRRLKRDALHEPMAKGALHEPKENTRILTHSWSAIGRQAGMLTSTQLGRQAGRQASNQAGRRAARGRQASMRDDIKDTDIVIEDTAAAAAAAAAGGKHV